MKISAVIIAKNEERNIKDCLESLRFCDEIILVDDNSSDNTVELASSLGVKVFKRDIGKNCSAQLNFGMSKTEGDWILFIDADERVSKDLKKEILNSIQDTDISGFYLGRKDFMWGKCLKGGETSKYKDIRLVKSQSGNWKRRVHQKFNINGKTNTLKNPILHYPHPDIMDFVKSINRWSSWHSLSNLEEGKRSSILKIIFFPKFHFINNFIFNLGFRDGNEGFVVAVMMGFHSFLSWSKMWFMQKEK